MISQVFYKLHFKHFLEIFAQLDLHFTKLLKNKQLRSLHHSILKYSFMH